MPTEYLMLKELASDRPLLGDGFDPRTRYLSRRRTSAVNFVTNPSSASQQHAEVFEVSSTLTTSQTLTLSTSGKFSTYVSGRFSSTNEELFFSQNTVFAVFITAKVRREMADSVSLKSGLDTIGRDAFRSTYGSQLVKVINYGGYVSLLFRFSSLDTTSKNNVKAGLEFWSGAGDVSVDQALSRHSVRTQFEYKADQSGGSVPLFLGSTLQALNAHLASWYPTLASNAEPLSIEVVDYKREIANFPYQLSSGFGDLDVNTDSSTSAGNGFNMLGSEEDYWKGLAHIKPDGPCYLVELDPSSDQSRFRIPRSAVLVGDEHYTCTLSDGTTLPMRTVQIKKQAVVESIKQTTFQQLLSLKDISPLPYDASKVQKNFVMKGKRSELELFDDRYQVYAAPAPLWGPWEVVGSHIGRATFNISVEPIGDTQVRGEVRYFDNINNEQIVQPFFQRVTVQTGDSVANVEVRLQGVVTGSSCWVTVS